MNEIEVKKIDSLTGHRDCIYTLEKAGESNLFFSGAGDGMVVLWDLRQPENGQLIAKVENSVYALCYLKAQKHLLVGHNFEGLHMIDMQSRKEVLSSKITDSYIFDIKAFDRFVFVATGDGCLSVLDIKDLSVIMKIKLSDKSVRAIAINEQEEIIALALSDNSIKILSLERNRILYDIPQAHANSVFTVAFSPDGKYLLSGSRDAHMKIWDSKANFRLHKSVVAHMFAINHIDYSEDKRLFATCSMDKSVKIWNADEFRLLKVIDKSRHSGHGTSVNKLLWTGSPGTLVSASDDRTISVWQLNYTNI